MQSTRFFSLPKTSAAVALLLTCILGYAAESDSNRVVVPLSDPSRPPLVKTHLLNGSITVKGYEGKEVIVETRGHSRENSETQENAGGLRRIPQTGGLSVDAENNEVDIRIDSLHPDMDLVISVPHRSSLSLSSVNGSNIAVSDVEGEIDVNSTNGKVTLDHVAGSVVAHALNGRVMATFTRVNPQKPMAFSSMNGDIDVTFPADVKANLSLRTDNGEVYSDFDIQLQQAAPQSMVEDGQGKGGKYRVRVDKTLHATLNGGGPEIQFNGFNGNIYIRKAK